MAAVVVFQLGAVSNLNQESCLVGLAESRRNFGGVVAGRTVAIMHNAESVGRVQLIIRITSSASTEGESSQLIKTPFGIAKPILLELESCLTHGTRILLDRTSTIDYFFQYAVDFTKQAYLDISIHTLQAVLISLSETIVDTVFDT